MEPTLSSETSAFKLQTPGKFPKEHRLPHKFFSVGVLEFSVPCFTVTLLIFKDFLVLMPPFQLHCTVCQ
jgi:hypothetical protein